MGEHVVPPAVPDHSDKMAAQKVLELGPEMRTVRLQLQRCVQRLAPLPVPVQMHDVHATPCTGIDACGTPPSVVVEGAEGELAAGSPDGNADQWVEIRREHRPGKTGGEGDHELGKTFDAR